MQWKRASYITHVQSGLFHHLPSIFLSPENLTKTMPPSWENMSHRLSVQQFHPLQFVFLGSASHWYCARSIFLTSRSKSQQNPSPAHPAPSFPGRWPPHVSKCNVWPHKKLQFAPPLSPQCPCNTSLRYVLYRICDASLRSSSWNSSARRLCRHSSVQFLTVRLVRLLSQWPLRGMHLQLRGLMARQLGQLPQ